MSIVIRGMEMPKHTTKAEFGIDADGNPLCMIYHQAGTEPDIYDIIPLPERHGRLIDADALRKEFPEPEDWKDFAQAVHHITGIWATIDTALTIVPAEGGGEDG